MYANFFGFESLAPNIVTITYGSDVTGFDAGRVGRGMPRAPFPFCGCGGTPHGRGSFAERTVSGGRLSGRGKGVAKQAGVATGGPLFTICTKRGCWYLVAPEPFGDGVRDLEECSRQVSEGSAARTYCCSGRTWTPLALPVRGERETGGRKAGWPGFPHSEKERARTEGESGKAGVPSQWEGTGQEEKERDVSKVGSGVGVGGWFGRWTGSGVRIRIGIGMSSAGSARYFCCLGRAMVGLRAAGDSRLGRWGSSAQRGVRVLSAGRNTGSGADSVDAVKAVGFRANFLPRAIIY
jgi:hypothetical protein